MKIEELVRETITDIIRTNPLNRMPYSPDQYIFDEPLLGFADGDDPLFSQYKTIIDPAHLTPREAFSMALGNNSYEPLRVSVMSWILPITEKTRLAQRQETEYPSADWRYTRTYGEQFNESLRKSLIAAINGHGYRAVAPAIEPYFKQQLNVQKQPFSNWSERHIAYAAGLGTFSLSDGFITELGIAHRCGSVVIDLEIPASNRIYQSHYSNCLSYNGVKCQACIKRCPAGAISESGHDKVKCMDYCIKHVQVRREEWGVSNPGCGLCQVRVPCEFQNPTNKLKRLGQVAYA